ncbi:MAG TPA: M23 family metallopeptidase [Burkholderiales bacterium]|nr:M23 family metallopeptidase [Burkholderiales bacterium]
MHIIVVPGSRHGKGNNVSLSTRQTVLLALVLFVFLPGLIGVMSFKLQEFFAQQTDEVAQINTQKRELAAQRVAIHEARREAVTHLNALAQRMGQMQAQVLRLNALGSRLTRMAGLDPREFNFSAEPAMGGPEKGGVTLSSPNLTVPLERLAGELDRQQERLVALENLLLDRKLSAAVTPSGWPVDGGWVSSGFGRRADPFTGHQSMHEGVDLATRYGSPIQAMGDGLVTFSGDKAGYGLMVEITHDSALVTRYAHTSETSVKVGDRVQKGQQIALVGTSGRTTGPHLHFELLRDGNAVNPLRYLQQANSKP